MCLYVIIYIYTYIHIYIYTLTPTKKDGLLDGILMIFPHVLWAFPAAWQAGAGLQTKHLQCASQPAFSRNLVKSEDFTIEKDVKHETFTIKDWFNPFILTVKKCF